VWKVHIAGKPINNINENGLCCVAVIIEAKLTLSDRYD
jgi:hypothetical protein